MMNSKLLVILFVYFYKYTLCVPTLEVDVKTGHQPISEYIYGMNFKNDNAFMKEIKLPFNRWGGNAATRYNWKNDVSNRAADWFFENLPEDNKNPEKLPDGSRTDVFTQNNTEIGVKTMITIPLIGWTPKDRERRCGFSVKKYGEQEKTDQWMPDCGNGMKKDGKTPITGNDPHDTSIPITPSFAKEWVQHLVKKFGTAAKEGVMFYEMDNEYDLWPGTHRDIKPQHVSGNEIIKLTEEYAAAVKEADPSALILGPVGTHIAIWNSGFMNDDRKDHGNVDFGEYYLKSFKAYEDKHKKRILDYYDLHYYPALANPNDPAAKLRSTRSLWDFNHTDESWLRDLGTDKSHIHLIPRMKKLLADNYPGTKIAITEYSWGDEKTILGALTQADVLGIFGREDVGLASLWGGGNTNEPWAFGFRMFRNYDGKGSQFGDISVTAKSSNQDKLAIYASVRTHDKAVVIIVINKDPNEVIDTKVSINGLDHKGSAKTYTYSKANLQKIIESETPLSGNSLSHKFPAYSITLFELPSK